MLGSRLRLDFSDLPEEGIRIEKARWGRHNIIKGRTKAELAKDVDVSKVSLDRKSGE